MVIAIFNNGFWYCAKFFFIICPDDKSHRQTAAKLSKLSHSLYLDLWFYSSVDRTLFYGYHTPRLLGLYICDSLQRNNHSPLEFRGLFWSSGAISTTARVCHWWVLLSIIIYYTIYKYYKWHRLCIAWLKSSESKKNFDDCIIAINVWLYTLSTNQCCS